jgi:hypothetical protein
VTHKKLFFQGQPKLAWLFEKPWRLASILALCGLGLTSWSFLLGLGHFRNSAGCPVGFVDRPNCSAMYVLILPFLFYLGSDLLRIASSEIANLTSKNLSVIAKSPVSNSSLSFEELLQERVSANSKLGVAFAATVAAIATIVTFDLFFVRSSNLVDDWSQSYLSGSLWHKLFSVALDCAVFALQGIYVFLGLFWATKIATFMFGLVRPVFHPNQDFQFAPIITDPQKRLGLSPLGNILTRIGLIVLIFEAYVALYSIQDTADHRHGECLMKYLQETLNPKNTFGQVLGLGYIKSVVDFGGAGTISLIALCVVLWLCYSYIPLFVIRPRLARLQNERWRSDARVLDRAYADGDEKLSKRLEAQFRSLDSSTFWPNGANLGLTMCLSLACIPILAFYPPALGYAVASGLVLAAYKTLLAKK